MERKMNAFKQMSWAENIAEIERECELELRSIDAQRERLRRDRPVSDMTRTIEIWERWNLSCAHTPA